MNARSFVGFLVADYVEGVVPFSVLYRRKDFIILWGEVCCGDFVCEGFLPVVGNVFGEKYSVVWRVLKVSKKVGGEISIFTSYSSLRASA